MKAVELQLFEVKKDTNSNDNNDALLIEEKQPAKPLRIDIYDKVNQFFNETDEEKEEINQARQILGEKAKDLNDGQIKDLICNVEYLVDSWIEEFEKSIFEGKTFNEVFQIKGK